jgi:hypothetical protein
MLCVLCHNLIFPRFEHLLTPYVDHPALFINIVPLALILELSEIPKHLLILLLDLDELI